MIEYLYHCQQCGYNWSQFQSIKEDSLTHCADCGCETAKRVLVPFQMTIKQEVSTVGQMIDRNTAQMGLYEHQEKTAALRTDKPDYTGKYADKAFAPKQDKALPLIDVNKLNTVEKMDRYVMEGKMPL